MAFFVSAFIPTLSSLTAPTCLLHSLQIPSTTTANYLNMRFATAADQLGASNPFYRPVVNEGTFWGFLESLNVHREGNQKDHRLFRALFGCPPLVCVDLWETCSFTRGTAPKHMMWSLLFLKVYATEDVLCSILRCCRRTFRKWLWPTVLAIAKAKPIVVSGGAGCVVCMIVYYFG